MADDVGAAHLTLPRRRRGPLPLSLKGGKGFKGGQGEEVLLCGGAARQPGPVCLRSR